MKIIKRKIIHGAVLVTAMAALSACLTGKSHSNNDASTQANQGPKVVTLRIMETTDIHANVMNFNYYRNGEDNGVGLVKTASLIQGARNEVSNSVLVDNGDLIQGSPLGDYFAKVKGLASNEVHPIYKAMNLLDYDVANIGNHEFNFGLEFLEEAINDANFPYISANVFNAGDEEPYFQPYLIKQKTVTDAEGNTHELDIGYIGFVPPQIMQWDKSNLEGKVIAKDIVEMAEKYVPMMKQEGADIIIAIPHSGLNADIRKGNDENASFYLAGVDGIDAIMFGHAHRNFPGDAGYNNIAGIDNVNGTINGIPAVMPGFWGNHLGIIDLTLNLSEDDIWTVAGSRVELRAISKRGENRKVISLVEAHKPIVEAVKADHQSVVDWVSAPFAKISAPINSFFALVQDDPSIQVVTDAQKAYVEKIIAGTDMDGLPVLSVGAPFRAGRGGADDFTNLQAGDVSYGNVADLYIYPNTLKVLELTGAEVKEWLEMSAGQFNQIVPGQNDTPLINTDFPSYNFDVIDGVTYQIDVTQPARYSSKGVLSDANANRIVSLQYQGKAINPTQKFLVISNNYRASGGGRFPGVTAEKIVIDAPDENRQTVADYLIAETKKNPNNGFDPSADGNWSLKPVSDTTATFLSSPTDAAKTFAGNADAISFLRNNADGYGLYSIDLSAL